MTEAPFYSTVPTLWAVPHKPGGFKVWCDYCRTGRSRKRGAWHYHGPPIPGHRAAHCTAVDSPYSETGYYLVRSPFVDPGAYEPKDQG